MTWWWLPPTRCPHPNTDFLHVLGLEEASDVSLHLQPLQAVLEEMEQADYSQVSNMWQNNQAQPGGLICAAAEPQRLQGGIIPPALPHTDEALPPPAAALRAQGALHCLPAPGSLRALPVICQHNPYPAGDLQLLHQPGIAPGPALTHPCPLQLPLWGRCGESSHGDAETPQTREQQSSP